MKLSLSLALTLILSACVTKGTFNELQADYDRYRHSAEQRERKHQEAFRDLEQALSDERARLTRYQADTARLEAQIAALNAEKATLLKDKGALLEAEAEMREALDELARRKAQADARIGEYQELLDRFKGLIDAGRLRVRIIDGQMVVQLATDVLFSPGSAVLSRDGRDAIVEVTEVLASIGDRRFQVAGHTDNVPIRTSRYPSNWELGFDRALTVVRTMIDAGMPPSRIAGTSYGEFKPTATNETDAGRAQNRRIEIVVVPDLSTLPGAEELERLGGGEG